MPRIRKAASQSTSPERPCAAADALFQAIRSPKGFDARVPIFLGAIRPDQSLPQGVFTQAEALDGVDMLMRMGLVCIPTHALGRNYSFTQFGSNKVEAFRV